MSSTTKKPATPGNNARQSITPTGGSPAPNRSPSRLATQTTPATATKTATSAPTTSSGLARNRSVRGGAAPVSARAAARKPAESDTSVEDVKAEMQAKMDELQQQLQQAERSAEDAQKQSSMLQTKLDDALKEQGMLEENVHEQSEKLEELENARKESERAKRELEQIYETERAASMKEKEAAQVKQDEMEAALQRMKESLAHREMRAAVDDDRRPSPTRGSSFRGGSSPGSERDGQFAPSSLQRSDSRSSSKLVIQKDKIIEGLRMEVAEAQIRLVEMENMGGGQLQEIQKQLYDIKIQNARLMEENESFQLLLSEKTLNGDFAQSELLRPPSPSTSGRSPSRHAAGTSLADELASEDDHEGGGNPHERRLQGEVNSLRDQNKALTLYINNIISRLLQHEQFEQILDKTPDLMAGPNAAMRKYVESGDMPPPPPPPKDDDSTGLLQRARSVISGKPKRPLSFVPSGDGLTVPRPGENLTTAPRPTENLTTAPSIPIGRSNSTTRGHRRANSDWPAASVVTSMYRPTPGVQGPTSPGLGSPNSGRPFFSSMGPTPPSAPTSDPLAKENISQRDSKVSNRNSMQSNHRTSMQSNPGFNPADYPEITDGSNPSSPPRSTTSSDPKDARAAGAIMMGSKMRPLRLVQETSKEDEAAKKAANRGSWFGWMNKGIPAPANLGARSASGEGGGV